MQYMVIAKKISVGWLSGLTLLLLIGTAAMGQDSFPTSGGTAGDLLSDPAFKLALAFQESHRLEESLAEVRKVAAAHAGTELEAAAMTEIAELLRLLGHRAANSGNSISAADLLSQSEAEWRRIVDRFPNTKYWLNARIALRNEGPPGTYALLEEVSGVSYEEVRTGRQTSVKGENIPVQYRQYVMDLFHSGAGQVTPEEEARFQLFFLKSFPREGSITDLRGLYMGEERGTLNDSLDVTSAVLEVSSPQNGAVVSGSGAALIATAHDGDIRSRQVEMRDSVVELDGQDILPSCDLDYRIDPGGATFATLELRYTPPVPLAPGPHTYRVAVRESGEGQITERVINFTVDNAPPPPPPPPTTETRSATKDALVYEKSPHSNEGANPRLTLEKITGKSARNLLGFDLGGVNTNSLTSATLVLTIDPSDQVTGWGNGETVSIKPVTAAWQEGNGKKHGLPGSQQTTGSGAGTTWFSPTDENISNDSANAVVQWSGAAAYATAGTAPSLTVHNHQTGELRFDVTDDVLNGVAHGWLLRKDAENKGSKVSFYSREGGGANLGPRLILEYGGPTAMSGPQQIYSALAGFFGFSRRPATLQASAGGSEGSRGLKELLLGSPRAAYVGEQVVLGFAGRHPFTQLGARVVYRSWLRETPSLV
jgi:hypothetical protein